LIFFLSKEHTRINHKKFELNWIKDVAYRKLGLCSKKHTKTCGSLFISEGAMSSSQREKMRKNMRLTFSPLPRSTSQATLRLTLLLRLGTGSLSVTPGFKNKTRYTPYVSPGSQISHIVTNKGNIKWQCLIYNVLIIKDITL
jgi:hypothetical protein